jgi:hypothetical protein
MGTCAGDVLLVADEIAIGRVGSVSLLCERVVKCSTKACR